jgi:predicted negative regulator of RcsB-dependent stress response
LRKLSGGIMPKQIKKRSSKRSVDTEEDVKDKLATFVDTIKDRQKSFLTYGVVVLVIIVAVIGFFMYSFNAQKTATQLSYDAYNIYYNEYQKSPLKEQERYEKALNLFTQAYETKKSPRDLLYIALCYYDLGRYDDALKTLEDFTTRYSNEYSMIPLAYMKLAQVYQRKGDTDKALKTLDSFSHFKRDTFKDFALMESGLILEKEGKLEEAKNKFNEITTRFPHSPFFEEAKSKIAEKKKEG